MIAVPPSASRVALGALALAAALGACSPFESSSAPATPDGALPDGGGVVDGALSDAAGRPWQELPSSFGSPTDEAPYGWDRSVPASTTPGVLWRDPVLGDKAPGSLATAGNKSNAYLEKSLGDAAEVDLTASLQVLSFTGTESIHVVHVECDADKRVYLKVQRSGVGVDAVLSGSTAPDVKLGFNNLSNWMQFHVWIRRLPDRTEIDATLGNGPKVTTTSADGLCAAPRLRVGASSVSNDAIYDLRFDDITVRWR